MNKDTPMEDLDDSMSSTGFKSLFAKEEDADPDSSRMERSECNTAQTGLTFTGTQLAQSALIQPYLQEMGGLLKSCEGLTGIPFSSHFTASYNETTLTKSSHSHSRGEESTASHGERCISPSAYLVTSYIDTHMDGVETEDEQAQGQSRCLDPNSERRGVIADVCCQREMPLTSAGHKLSGTMLEYEGKLMGMLAMLDNCMGEAEMDFEPQDWGTDASQEYVHISQSSKTTLAPLQQGNLIHLENQPMHIESWSQQEAGEDEALKESRNEVTGVSASNGSQQSPMLHGDNMGAFSKKQLESQWALKTENNFSLQMPLYRTEKYSLHHEGLKTEGVSTAEGQNTKDDVTEIEVDETGQTSEEDREPRLDNLDLGSGRKELSALGRQIEECIEEVQRLEKRRNELLAEGLGLRGNSQKEEAEDSNKEKSIDRQVIELMSSLRKEEEGRREESKREIQSLGEERAEEERRVWRVQLERQGLQDELRNVKRSLFAMARDCAQNQFTLNTQHHEVAALSEEEKLQSLLRQLTEERSNLRTAHNQQILDLQARRQAQSVTQTSVTQDELTQCKRHSCGDIQQYLQGGLKALEDRYEPILLALLKRREAAAAAQVKAREHAQELRAQLRPLKEEIQKLNLQRSCLDQKLKIIHLQRREDAGQYKEAIFFLEESSRELKTELKIQKRKTNAIEDLRDSLSQQLQFYKAAIEHHTCDDMEKT
ncbi:myosin heavy chain, muscle isoform X2 [Brachionichthys hirsutus]|uniref:myosin heavy chain, muscle isoform X2 n=1 Tax=Brachionichthys hirsutus TaxID=412623 RepID=UPI003604C2EF